MISDDLINEIKVAVNQAIDRVVFQHRQRLQGGNAEWFRPGAGSPDMGRGSDCGDVGTHVQEPR